MKDQPIQMFCGHSWLTSKALASSSQKHGKGVFCKEKIMEGERIAIFGGSIMHIEEMKNYTEQQQEYPMQIEQRFVLGRRSCDGEEDTDFFNHSCDPNAGFRGQIFLVAMRDINEGEEVTFDYAMVASKSSGSDIVFEMDCRCGSKICRGKITEDDWKMPELRERYAGFFSQYIKEMIDAEGSQASKGGKRPKSS